MTQRFNDMARERDALYQALQPFFVFEEALYHDRQAATGKDILVLDVMKWAVWHSAARDKQLLRLAIRALKARKEVKPGND